jgi:TPR repeat protein
MAGSMWSAHMRTGYRAAQSFCVAAIALMMAACTYQAPHEEDFEAGMQAYQQQDYQTAITKWRPLAEDGNTSAQVNMGVMYFQGLGVTRDYAEALKWYKMAALKGHAEAEYNLGVAYAQGRGTQQDQREALRWYRQSAERGYVPAQMMLAKMHYEGQGVAVNHAEAARWYRQASYQGFSIAQYMLGTMYATGQGVGKDLVQAHMWLTLSAQQGNEPTRQNTLRIRDRLAEQMTPEQIVEAERLARDWSAQNAPAEN